MAVVSCKTFNLINERAAAWSSEKIVFPFAIWLSALLLCELFTRGTLELWRRAYGAQNYFSNGC
jgi:predicted membrane-bound mannosyltransferase